MSSARPKSRAAYARAGLEQLGAEALGEVLRVEVGPGTGPWRPIRVDAGPLVLLDTQVKLDGSNVRGLVQRLPDALHALAEARIRDALAQARPTAPAAAPAPAKSAGPANGERPVGPGDNLPTAGAAPHGAGTAGRLAGASARARVVLRTLREVLANPTVLNGPEPIAEPFAWAGRVTLLAAREKMGKSTLLSAIAAAVSSGRPFLHRPIRSGTVLWIGLEEDAGDLAPRLMRFKADPDRVVLVDALPDRLASLATAVEEVKPSLVVLDTLPAFALGLGLVRDANAAGEWSVLLGELTKVARRSRAALVLLHHSRKSGEGYRDSSAVGANVDLILEMSEANDDPSLRRFRAKARWSVPDFGLRLQGDTYGTESGEVSIDTRVLWFVQTHPGCSKRLVREGVAGANAEIDAALVRLERIGAIENRGTNGSNAYFPRVATPPVPDPVPEPAENAPSGTVRGTPPVPDSGHPRRSNRGTVGAETGSESVLAESEACPSDALEGLERGDAWEPPDAPGGGAR